VTVIRREEPGDAGAVRVVNERAFDGPAEANIVDRLRSACPDALSLVAVVEGQVVGHILFSPATVAGAGGEVRGMGLAPMAVLPGHQRRGIGSELVRAGLEMLRAAGCRFVIVLGHADYYPRFGFERASLHGVLSQWEGVPDDAFMILLLDESLRGGLSGTARYRSEFDEAM